MKITDKMSLSDKEIIECGIASDFIKVEDVQKAVQELKEELIGLPVTRRTLLIIDKIFGEKLCSQKEKGK